MDNKFLDWVKAMNSMDFRVKIVTQNRNASASYTHEAVMTMEQLFLDTVQRPGIGSITVTAPCGCAYRFEKTENHADAFCDTYWVRAVFDGEVDE